MYSTTVERPKICGELDVKATTNLEQIYQLCDIFFQC